MTAFSRVVVTADLLRPFLVGRGYESATWKNTRWLFRMLEPALRECAQAPRMLAWDERASPLDTDWFDTPALYHALGLEPSPEAWARLCGAGVAPQPLLDALEPHVRDALVVGYELPPPMVDALARLGRPFVDVILHPVRFMPDLVFALRTNVPAFHRAIAAQRLPEREIRAQAGRILAKVAWMQRPMELPPGTALLLGQVAGDRAMVAPDGTFASLEAHSGALHELCCSHPLVLFRPHPYAGADDPSLRAVGRLPAIRSVQHNFYHLLAQPEVSTVVALNSSGLIEARHFGREAINLAPFLYDFDDTAEPRAASPGAPVPLDAIWTTAEFWRGMLTASAELPGRIANACVPPETLRRSMNADWSYGLIGAVCA